MVQQETYIVAKANGTHCGHIHRTILGARICAENHNEPWSTRWEPYDNFTYEERFLDGEPLGREYRNKAGNFVLFKVVE